MISTLQVPFALLVAHFAADFLLQSNWMALNKSKRWDALFYHVAVYSLPFLYWGWPFAAVTFAAHFVTDAVTSRWTSKLWFLKLTEAGKKWRLLAPEVESLDPAYWVDETGTRHWFFVVIGFDQLLHALQLGLTYRWLVER